MFTLAWMYSYQFAKEIVRYRHGAERTYAKASQPSADESVVGCEALFKRRRRAFG